ncbi:ribonuclease Y [Candidatus Berkelbacteria bacterium]|nr:ribonuclease Y [Candidatus Berkelbacteria bacterium]
MYTLLYVALALIVGGGAGFIIRSGSKRKSDEQIAAKQKEILLEAKNEAIKIKEEAKADEEDRRKRIDSLEGEIRQRESRLESRVAKLDDELKSLDSKRQSLNEREKSIDESIEEQKSKLEKIASLNKEEAREELLHQVELEFKEDLIAKVKEQKHLAQQEFDAWSRKILATSMERLASETTAEHSIQPISIPSEEMKGRIIGKEGRNIQAFEKLTGVDVVIDESPDTITISSFNPIRRHMARVAMERLVSDGRIHPGKIEETWEKVDKEVNKEIQEAGEQAARDAGIAGLHPDLLKIMGQLKFRTSYGQNVLKHSIEMANLGAMIAAEIGADVNVSRKACFLHDIGKAVDHEVPGPHHHISMDIARKYGMSEVVINAIGAHHGDIEAKTVEALIVRIADAISGSRPGARRDTYENYVKRVTELENIAKGFEGVAKAFAVHAGREIRILVTPEDVNDLEALKLAQKVARKIEQDLQYPGMIKVNVIRETRSHEFAK